MLDTDIPPEAVDAQIARAERRLALLEALSGIGMRLAEHLERDHRAWRNPAAAFATLSRAIRLTIMLEGQIEEELAALQAGTPPPAVQAWAASKPPSPSLPRPCVEHAEPAVEAEAETRAEMKERRERLVEREDYSAILSLPFEEAVKQICKLLDIDGDRFLADWRPPPPKWSPAPPPPSADPRRLKVRARTVEAINTELVMDEYVTLDEADRALKDLDERLFATRRYDPYIHGDPGDAASAILYDLGLNPGWPGAPHPPPQPPPHPPPRTLGGP